MTEAELVRIMDQLADVYDEADRELARLRLERKIEQATARPHLRVVSS